MVEVEGETETADLAQSASSALTGTYPPSAAASGEGSRDKRRSPSSSRPADVTLHDVAFSRDRITVVRGP